MNSRAAVLLSVLVVGLAGCGGGGGGPAAATALPPELLDIVTTEVDCAGQPLVQVRAQRGDFTGDAVEDALLAVRCDAGAGAPPSAVFAIAAAPKGPQVVAELLAPAAGEVVNSLEIVGTSAVVRAFGFSEAAPRCCPDLDVTHRYAWDGAAFDQGTRHANPLPEADPAQ